MNTRPLVKADYDHIVRIIDEWWGGPTSALAHPIFFYELGELARVVEVDGRVVGFLFGFIAGKVGYVHLVGIDPEFRRKRVGTMLYNAFEEACVRSGCVELKAISTLGNEASQRFHQAHGWSCETVADYAGPGRSRVVFRKTLTG
ncbi:MAG: GNAT family N-acetyltransferase [Polyangiaceae bacterium]|nr:GNAT family N-acetyltransferase [Polyangiaceae bacterium]